MGHEGFRQNEIHFLQEQNKQVLETLERVEAERDRAHEQIRACEERDTALQNELQAVRDRVSVLTDRLHHNRSETVAKDEHVRVLSEQNKQMLGLLETEENKSKEQANQIRALETKNRKLQKIAEEFDAVKAELEKQVAAAKARCVEVVAAVRSLRNVNDNVRANIQNTEAKTRVDLEALGQALQVVEQKNLEYMQRINKQETKEQQLRAETETMKEEVENVRTEIDKLRQQFEGDGEGRLAFERARGQIEVTIEALEVQADTLKKALSTAERANEQLQEENRASADRCRETADKVYALMDSLRLNQVELKKQEAENAARDKKIMSLERQTQNLQAKVAMEVDAKVLAEQERKEAEQESSVLKKKNKKVEEAITHSQAAQEKADKEVFLMNERVGQLQTQNAYLASRIDGQEEEKNTLKADIRRVSDRTNETSAENSRLRDAIDHLQEQVTAALQDKEQYQKELEYIKREDVLDDAGRQRPILIQSTESDLLDKLQINEFLYEAQQARNPVPPLIEKIAQLLAMLHEGQQRADQHLGDLSKSNGLVSALRQRNMALFSKTQMFESFKSRALLRYVMNLCEGDRITEAHLDGLSFGQREINEMISLLQRYDATDKVYVLSLIDNGLDEDSIGLLLQLIFTLPYLRLLDLRRNCMGQAGIKRIEEQLRTMEGVTGVIRTANQVINVHSGNQLRLSVDVSEQLPKDQIAKEVEFTVPHELNAIDADPFLMSDAGQSQHPFSKSLTATQRSLQKAVPEPSSTELGKTAVAVPPPPTVNGPPVGLGGPGNVAALNKKAAGRPTDRLPDPKKRQARRAKAAPPPLLDYIPNQRVLDKWQAAAVPVAPSAAPARPLSSSRRSGSSRPDASARWVDMVDRPAQEACLDQRRQLSLERSCSMPALVNQRKVVRSARPVYGARP